VQLPAGGILMERMIPLEKMSKKAKRAYHAARRGTWGAISPVTRAPLKPGAYKRKKSGAWRQDLDAPDFYILLWNKD
jgi:hypothetical protein